MIPSDDDYTKLCQMFRSLFGLALGPEKKYLISLRLESVLKSHRLTDYQELIALCQRTDSNQLRSDVIDAMTTRETSFFRDSHPFIAIEKTILPELVARFLERRKVDQDKIRFWSAACSTGQEPYCLAMLIDEHLQSSIHAKSKKLRAADFSVTATDISAEAIRVARNGKYSAMETHRGLSQQRLQLHFTSNGGQSQINDHLKALVEFQQCNILQPPQRLPQRMDLILCRNILIYFDEQHRLQLLENLSKCLDENGYLILGAAESTSQIPDTLVQIAIGSTTVYRKRTQSVRTNQQNDRLTEIRPL